MDRMSPLDTSFLHIEDSDRAVSLHIGSIGVFEGPPPAHDVMARTMEQRLSQVRRCRQRVEFVPFGLERPLWVDDDDFSVDYHLRRTALPQPAGPAELRRLVGRLMSQRLDRTKPLWEMWVVEGLADGTWALVSKVHHCMVDGVSGAEILAVLLDVTPDPPEVEAPVWVPEPAPSRRDLVVDAARSLAFDGYEQVRLLGAQVRRPKRAVQQVLDLLPGLVSLGGVAAAPSTGGLTGPISPHREYAWADASLDDVKRVRKQLGGTVNDVVLAAVAGGFRHLLLSRGEDVAADRVVRTLVPVSVRGTRGDGAAAHDGSFDNRISAMFAELPVGVADPVDRLAAITGQLAGLKESGQAVAGEALTALSGFAPPALLALGMRVAARAVRGSGTVHTVTTNVPGPQLPLYSCGRRLLRAYPYVPIAPPLRTGVAIFSYDGAVTFGVTGDREVSRDVDVLAEGIEQALADLLAAADTSAPAPPEPHAPTPTVPPPTVPAAPSTPAPTPATPAEEVVAETTAAVGSAAPPTPSKSASTTKPSTKGSKPVTATAPDEAPPSTPSTKKATPTKPAAPDEAAASTPSTKKPAPVAAKAAAAGKGAAPSRAAAKKTAGAKKATAAATRVGAAKKTAAATRAGAAKKAAVAKKVGAAKKTATATKVGAARKAAVAKKVGAAKKTAAATKVGAAKKVSGAAKKRAGGGGT